MLMKRRGPGYNWRGHMKRPASFALGILLLVAPRTGAQGTITMANYQTDPNAQAWSAPIYNTDGVTPLTAPYEVALYVGASPAGVLLVPGSTTLLGPGGLFNGGTLTISGESPGSGLFAVIYAWDSTYGTTWQQAGHGAPIGESEPFIITVGSSSSPGSLYGMQSFYLAGSVPEPRTIALFSLGGAFLVGAGMRRRSTRGA